MIRNLYTIGEKIGIDGDGCLLLAADEPCERYTEVLCQGFELIKRRLRIVR